MGSWGVSTGASNQSASLGSKVILTGSPWSPTSPGTPAFPKLPCKDTDGKRMKLRTTEDLMGIHLNIINWTSFMNNKVAKHVLYLCSRHPRNTLATVHTRQALVMTSTEMSWVRTFGFYLSPLTRHSRRLLWDQEARWSLSARGRPERQSNGTFSRFC